MEKVKSILIVTLIFVCAVFVSEMAATAAANENLDQEYDEALREAKYEEWLNSLDECEMYKEFERINKQERENRITDLENVRKKIKIMYEGSGPADFMECKEFRKAEMKGELLHQVTANKYKFTQEEKLHLRELDEKLGTVDLFSLKEGPSHMNSWSFSDSRRRGGHCM